LPPNTGVPLVSKGHREPSQTARDEAKQLMEKEAERQRRMQEKLRAEKKARLEAEVAERERVERERREEEERRVAEQVCWIFLLECWVYEEGVRWCRGRMLESRRILDFAGVALWSRLLTRFTRPNASARPRRQSNCDVKKRSRSAGTVYRKPRVLLARRKEKKRHAKRNKRRRVEQSKRKRVEH
jgi:hypothetical protein